MFGVNLMLPCQTKPICNCVCVSLGVSFYFVSSQRGNSRPIRFEPPMLDFHEQPVGMPKMEKVYLHNPSSEEISLISISATTSHFHASFFQNRIIPPGGNTSFDVVFLARVVGNVENTLFINTSHHGVFTYQVFGVGIPNPYRLRPFVGARVPVNSSFSPLISIFNPHSEPLQVVEMYTSGGDLHLELPTGQQGGTKKLWEIAPFETKGVMRASFSSRDADNHTAFIRIKTNASNEDEFIILPVEVEVTTAPGIYSSTEMLDFGTLRSQDRPKQLNLHLLNSGAKDVSIMSVRPTPSNEAVTVEFKQITLKAGESRYTKVASISFDASKARRSDQFSGKITVKAKEKSYSKLEIPYQAEVLEGYLGFDHTSTLFHIRDSPVDPVDRPIFLTNTFNFAIRIHNVSLPEEAKTMFNVHNFSTPVLIPPHESRYIFSLLFRPVRPSIHIDSNILLITNASKFHLPVRAYTGFLEPVVLPPCLREQILDFGVLSATDTSSLVFVVVNSNPIELEIKSWLVTGDSLSMELLNTERGNRSVVFITLYCMSVFSQVILASGYYAAFKVTLVAKALEGVYDGAVHITTDYEVCVSSRKQCYLFSPKMVQGKVVHQGFSIQSSFSQKVRLQQIRSLTEDVRFYYKRLRSNKVELEPRRKSKVPVYFILQCGDHCYVGLPFVLKSESRPHGLVMQEDIWDADVDLHQRLLKRWRELKQQSGLEVEAFFEVNTDLQKNVQAKILAQLTWPLLVNSSQQIHFPLTNTNSSSEEEVILENPADVPVYVQVLPVALYPNPSVFTGRLADRLSNINIDTNTLEFQVHTNHVSYTDLSFTGFVEGLTRPYVYNMLLMPGEIKSLNVRFRPITDHSVSSLLVIRNNLTVVDLIVVHGQGTTESLRLAGKAPGLGGSLRFKLTEAFLKDCSEAKAKEPNFTLRRTFRLENTGLLPLHIQSMEISGSACEGYGFKVLNCEEFALKPNTSKDLIILFTPDFTSSRVIRELKLVTAGGSVFAFVLNASLPYHMLAVCAETLPRPSWELELYIIVSLIMSSMFLLVIATAYLEAQGIWEPFKRRLSVESNSPMETGKPFDLREIVRIQMSESKGKVKNKTKALKKKEEKERKSKGKTQEDLKEPLADNDDSSSTTTETSNPDMEANIKEFNISVFFFLYSSLELPYVTPLEKQDKQRKTFTKTLANTGIHSVPKPRALSKSKFSGKISDDRPAPLGKFIVNGSMQELGHSSGSEGEKDSPPPEWDVPLNKTDNHSLQQISMQTMHADPFLKGSSSVMTRTCTPPPTSPSLVLRGSYGSVPHTSCEATLKKAPGNKLTKSVSLPGQNGNPTFAAVAAGYDKSPGEFASSKADSLGKVTLSHMTSVESDGSDSSGLWSPKETTSTPSFGPVNAFSAFGPNNPLNLSGGMQNSILGSAHSPWSFSRSIWSTGNDSTLHSFNPPTSSAVPDLVSHTAPPTPAPNDIGRTYNPWNMGWSPSLSRWNSEPWPNSPDNNSI
uniref:Transmembrane protein 131 n=1 Tax=Cyprinus carpio carpio TaxID=630221 RepID=A0A8C1I186_CYPCA